MDELASSCGNMLKGLAIAVTTVVAATALAEKIKQKSEAKEETEEKTATSDSSDAVYYGADIWGGTWKKVTGPMNMEEALAWVYATAFTKNAFGRYTYGKGAAWGIYTQNREDAILFALRLGGIDTLDTLVSHSLKNGEYPHYHLPGHKFGRYEHFHIWYGSIYN